MCACGCVHACVHVCVWYSNIYVEQHSEKTVANCTKMACSFEKFVAPLLGLT